jgi:MYXO-CTERM domain-containing protein
MRLLALVLLLAPSALAGSGGPDSAGGVYTDSDEADGPTYTWLDTSGGTVVSLADDDSVDIALPFAFSFYGSAYDQVTVATDGIVYFSGGSATETPTCPAPGSGYVALAALWQDLGAGDLTYDTFGTYPWRTFVVSWEGFPDATYGGAASFQVWLLEGRDEVVVQYADLDFGNAAVDGGAGAVVGTFSATSGLPWSCRAAFTDERSVWFGDENARPARANLYTVDLTTPWSGAADFAYAGASLHALDLNDDGEDDVLLGAPSLGSGAVWLLSGPWSEGSTTDDAAAAFSGAASNDRFGYAMTSADFDGDGIRDLAIGAPGYDSPGTDAGAVWLYNDGAFGGTVSTSSASASFRGPSSGRPGVGSAVASGDIDGDGYADLVVGAPGGDSGGTDSGTVYILNGRASFAGSYAYTSASSALYGVSSGDKLGMAVASGDVDGDGQDDVLAGAPANDAGAANAGAAELVLGSALPSGTTIVSGVASCTTAGDQTSMSLGTTVAFADLDGSGGLDVLLGAPYYDTTSTDAGAVFRFDDPGSGCVSGTASADYRYTGTGSSARFGSSLAAGDVNDDGTTDLVVGASNDPNYTPGGGAAYVFTTTPSASSIAGTDAEHRVFSSESGAAAGSAVATRSGTAGTAVLVGSPYADSGGSSRGELHDWTWRGDFQDDDGDGFVSHLSGGNDCDDDDASAWPGGTDTDGDSIDGDCDGWVDGVIAVRDREDWWLWDVAEIGGAPTTELDFETGTDGSVVASLGGVEFADGSYADVVSGAYPSGSLGFLVDGDTLALTFTEPVDAMALTWLDPADEFALLAYDDSYTEVALFEEELYAPDRAGGIFRGYTFIRSVTYVVLAANGGDGFGLDDLSLVATADTDRDRDGYTENEGDCDDTDADVNPAADEVLGNGIDDDCDGIVDGGAITLWTDEAAWTSAAGISPTTIDFEDLALSESVLDQYDTLGANFDGTPFVVESVDGTPALDTQAADADGGPLTVRFDEVQPALALTLLDVDGTVSVRGYAGGTLLYSTSFTGTGGQDFLGITTEYGLDTLVITASGDDFGADDLIFSALGLDDADGDGLTERDGDCDDSDPTVYAGAPDAWYDGVDSDCAGNDDDDADGDGVPFGSDCDDTDSAISPLATDTWYDGVDSDCDGADDYDADGDGFVSSTYGGTDCDDADATVSPDATEIWYDGVDQDCRGDDDYDADGDGYRAGGGSGGGDCDDGDSSVSPGQEEVPYDGVDNDCSEATADDDVDGDGYIAVAMGGDDCEDSIATAYPGAPGDRCYDGIDTDCDGSPEYDCDGDGDDSDAYGGTDCDDTDPTVHVGATDTMGDGVDQDCDGGAEYDFDFDGYDGVDYGGADCDDADPSVNPGATETCYDGVDQDCDGASDFDCDLDGYDSDLYGGTDCDDLDATRSPGRDDFPYDGLDSDCDGADDYDVDGDGHTAAWYGGDDCDDADPTVYPGAIDACYDGEDSDCGGDDDYDCDGDGYRSADWGGDDCSDLDDTVNPGVPEVAGDGIDQDCDGLDATTCTDCDGDGHDALALGGDDCDDTRADVYPGAPDTPYDGMDADCLGDDDYDRDGDGDRVESGGGTDCDDGDPLVNGRNTVDDCGNGNEDCDTKLDEDCEDEQSDTGGHDSGDTGKPSDTGDPDDTADADAWRPDAAEVREPEFIERGTVCGCDSEGTGAGALGLLAAAALVRRRRR